MTYKTYKKDELKLVCPHCKKSFLWDVGQHTTNAVREYKQKVREAIEKVFSDYSDKLIFIPKNKEEK